MFSKIKIFLELPNSHKWILTKICLIVPIIELGIKTIGFKRTFRILKHFVSNKNIELKETPHLIINRHSIYLYLFTKRLYFPGNCLAHSLTLWLLLKNKGIVTDLRFGMKKEHEKLKAHAWLEYKGSPLATKDEISENYSFFNESILDELGN